MGSINLRLSLFGPHAGIYVLHIFDLSLICGQEGLVMICLFSLELSQQRWCSSWCCLQVSGGLDTLSSRGWKAQRESCCSDWGWGKAWQAHTLLKQRYIHCRLEGGRRNVSILQGQGCWRCFRATPLSIVSAVLPINCFANYRTLALFCQLICHDCPFTFLLPLPCKKT